MPGPGMNVRRICVGWFPTDVHSDRLRLWAVRATAGRTQLASQPVLHGQNHVCQAGSDRGTRHTIILRPRPGAEP